MIEQIKTDIESIREEIQDNPSKDINIAFIESLLDRIDANLKPSDNSQTIQSVSKDNMECPNCHKNKLHCKCGMNMLNTN